MFRHVGKSKMALQLAHRARKEVEAVLWQDNPRGGGEPRYFFVRPNDENKKYHLRIIVGNVITTDRESVARGEVVRAARLMGINFADNYWGEVDSLR
jgi:hypothetical protein